MTQVEMDQIVSSVVEIVLGKMPDIIGNLMKHQAMVSKLNHQFYSENPEFKNNKDLVVKTIEQIETSDVSLKYEEILDKAIPIIKSGIKSIDKVDTSANLADSVRLKLSDKTDYNGII